MPSVLRSAAVFAFVSAVAIMSAPGCSQQGEGERCDFFKNGDADCDSGLTCVKKIELLENITDRCCPADGTESDTRCTRGTPMVEVGGQGNGGAPSIGEAGAGAAGEPSGGTPGASGAPMISDGGMTSGGVPAVTAGGAAGAPVAVAGASGAGAGGAP
jgi:hypothetical protein